MNGMRVLLVEDSEDEALLLTHELKQAGGDVCWKRVDTPEALRAALSEEDWDLVISDHAMPRFSSDCRRASSGDTDFCRSLVFCACPTSDSSDFDR